MDSGGGSGSGSCLMLICHPACLGVDVVDLFGCGCVECENLLPERRGDSFRIILLAMRRLGPV
jgi:hypothetical protein